jgi:formiminotetrahydrofolate cyclodeaminase
MLEILNFGGALAGVAGAVCLVLASVRTNSARIWKEEAEAQKTRADRLFSELEEIKNRLTHLEGYNATLVALLSTIDPQKLEELRLHRGL